jgi:hypothetical protein
MLQQGRNPDPEDSVEDSLISVATLLIGVLTLIMLFEIYSII